MKKATTTLLLNALILIGISGCKTAPVACFTVTTPADSIKVGTVVTFNSNCSSDATNYYWDFGNGMNSNAAPIVQTSYTTIATYSVTLVVANAGKTASLTKQIIVLP